LERIFVTIAAAETSISPADRVLTIYPRFTAGEASPGPGGLTVLPFREGTLSGRGSCLRWQCARFPGPLYPPGRLNSRHLSVRTLDRSSQGGAPLSPGLARRLADRCGQQRATDCKFTAVPRLTLKERIAGKSTV
jgi:hypothetical protein